MPREQHTAIFAGGRHNCRYNAQELAIIKPYKEAYFRAVSPAQRKMIAQNDIFPALFNFWERSGRGVTGEADIKKEIQVMLVSSFWEPIYENL